MSLVVTIPRRWMLSIRTCACSGSLITCLADNGTHVPVYGHEAQLALALALYNELYVLGLDVQTFRVWSSYDTVCSLLGPRSEWADYLQSLPQTTVPIGLFWGYKYLEDDMPDKEAIDWKGNHDLGRLFVNPETGVEKLASVLNLDGRLMIMESFVILDRNSWILRKSRGTVSMVVASGGEFGGVSSRIFSGGFACVSGRWIPRVEYGSHCGQVSRGGG